MERKKVFLQVFALAGFITCFFAVPSVRAEISVSHPRILIDSSWLSKIKCRAGIAGYENVPGEIFGSHQVAYNEMKAYYDSHDNATLDWSRFKKMPNVMALGLLYFCDGNTTYRDRMIDYANIQIASTTNVMDGYMSEAMAVVYDWLYPELDESLKTELEHQFQASSYVWSHQVGPASVHGAWNGHYIAEESTPVYVFSYLAIAGEELTDAVVEGGSYNGQTVSAESYDDSWILTMADQELKTNVIPAHEQAAGNNGGFQMGWGTYFGGQAWDIQMYLLAWRDSGVENLILGNKFISTLPQHFLFGLRPNRYGVAVINDDGDNDWHRVAGTYITNLLSAHITDNENTQWAINEHSPTGTNDDEVWAWVKPWYILYYDPTRTETAPTVSNLGDTLYEDGTGVILTRTGWESDDMLFMFKSGDYYDGHSHFDNNSFQLYFQGDLAVQSGSYSGDVTDSIQHYQNYYKRTVATNSLLIYDPDEQILENNVTLRHNDGGQKWPWGTTVSGYTVSRPQRAGDVIPGSEWDRAEIIKFENTASYVYALADATRSYSSAKCTQAKRGFFRFKDANQIFIFDYASTTDEKPNLEKKWLLHSMDFPVVTGDVGTDSRNGYGGGLVTYYNGSKIQITDVPKQITSPGQSTKNHPGGDGILNVFPLYPLNAEIRLIGGKDSSGYSYTDNSYEFSYNNQQHREWIFDDTPEMGAWRTEIVPTGSDIGKNNIFLNLLGVGDELNDPTTAVRISVTSGNMLGAAIRGGLQDEVVLISSDAEGDNVVGDISYQLIASTENITHYLLNMPPNTAFAVETASFGQVVNVSQDTGGTHLSSDQGVLSFETTATPDGTSPATPVGLTIQ